MFVEWIVGLFHDILEDNPNCYQIRAMLLELTNVTIYNAVKLLTRNLVYDQTYFDYIKTIKWWKDNETKVGEIAWKVKIADIKHNLSRTATLKPSLKKRHEKALRILLDGE